MRRLFENIVLLSAIKFCDMFIPLLIIPYVISQIGLNSYGVFAVCLTIFNFVLTFNDFGLNTLLAKKIAQNKDKTWAEENVTICTNIKLLLSLLSSLLFFVFAIINGGEYVYVTLFFIMGAVFESLSPISYFQGIQQLRYASVSQFSCRLISALFVFSLIRHKDDLALYAFIHNISYVINCVILFILINKKHNIKMKLRRIPLDMFKKIFQEAWHIYSFRFVSSLINPVITIFLSTCYGEQIVSIYSVSQRVCSAASRIYEPINNAIFPHIASIVQMKFSLFKKQSCIYIAFLLISSILVCVGLLAYQNQIQLYLIKRIFVEKELAIYFYAIVILIPSVLNMYLTYMLIALNKAVVIKNNLFLSMTILLIGLAFIYLNHSEPQYVAALLLMASVLLSLGLSFSLWNEIKRKNI